MCDIILSGVNDEKRKIAMLSTPVIDVEFDGTCFDIISNTEGNLVLIKLDITKEFEYDFKEFGGVQKVPGKTS